MKTKSPKVTKTTKKTKIITHGSTSGGRGYSGKSTGNSDIETITITKENRKKKNSIKSKKTYSRVECVECGELPHGDTDCYPEIDVPNIKEWKLEEKSYWFVWFCVIYVTLFTIAVILINPYIIKAVEVCSQ